MTSIFLFGVLERETRPSLEGQVKLLVDLGRFPHVGWSFYPTQPNSFRLLLFHLPPNQVNSKAPSWNEPSVSIRDKSRVAQVVLSIQTRASIDPGFEEHIVLGFVLRYRGVSGISLLVIVCGCLGVLYVLSRLRMWCVGEAERSLRELLFFRKV